MGADPSNLVSDSFSIDIEADESTSSSFVKLEEDGIAPIGFQFCISLPDG